MQTYNEHTFSRCYSPANYCRPVLCLLVSFRSFPPPFVCPPLVFPFHGEVLTMLPSLFLVFAGFIFLARAADVLFQYPVYCTQPLSRVACNFRLASVSVMRGAQKEGGGETKDFFICQRDASLVVSGGEPRHFLLMGKQTNFFYRNLNGASNRI